VSLNNEKICCEISEDKIAFCEKTAGLRRGKFSDSNSACLKLLDPVKIFQFQDMLNESERYQDAANGLKSANRIKVEIFFFLILMLLQILKLGKCRKLDFLTNALAKQGQSKLNELLKLNIRGS
jgi:hypothetical protein